MSFWGLLGTPFVRLLSRKALIEGRPIWKLSGVFYLGVQIQHVLIPKAGLFPLGGRRVFGVESPRMWFVPSWDFSVGFSTRVFHSCFSLVFFTRVFHWGFSLAFFTGIFPGFFTRIFH